MDLPNNDGISGAAEIEIMLRGLKISQASHQQQTPTIGTAANSKASRDLHFTCGGMWFFVFLELMVFALTGTHAGLLLQHERVGSEGGMGIYSFCIAWLSTYAAGASLLYTFVFSVTLCPPLAISIGFMRPEAAQGSSARLSPTCCGWAFVTVQYLLAAGFAAAMTAEQSRTEHVSPAILFGTAVAMFCGAASIITVVFFGAVEWTCMGTYLGMTRPRTADSMV